MTTRRRAYVGLGSNLGDREATLGEAVMHLRRVSPTTRLSPMYETRPLGMTRQPDFLNAVAEIRWSGAASGLLAVLQTIESRLGRRRAAHWGPRTVDLDLLLCGDHVCRDRSLSLPHPCIARRPFVLSPLLDLNPDICSPVTGVRFAGYRFLRAAGGVRRRRPGIPGRRLEV
ncbi:MAG: 2-amino-4-hydroxy-6-hydroxymethyldihydropteridine diphosphokinase [Candidatus Eisenbacteria bacterium]|jgi:2-amino-4-hydroxy-6-hydroxymethyldihydropteridine diphosphokinase|nr:2-amino-4-hydroxy-6-hydroxymethyldihydropteridine diphosphokinase [Candidatus Eisenbacteria bacterium]